MDDLISRQELLKKASRFMEYDETGCCIPVMVVRVEVIKNEPTIEAQPMRVGRWEWDTEDKYRCTNCGETAHVKEVMGKPVWGWRPNCGAKMEG